MWVLCPTKPILLETRTDTLIFFGKPLKALGVIAGAFLPLLRPLKCSSASNLSLLVGQPVISGFCAPASPLWRKQGPVPSIFFILKKKKSGGFERPPP
mmetsp:Transcript_32721/g.76229  ORF Transcript_32721/g.76229 Transcript_32721/m.76229 type:complete len:98 (+) Transcript_32721:610-903(+)